MEAFVCEQLGLTPVPATQVVARDRHAEFLYARNGGRVRRELRPRDPPPPADRGARGRGAVPRGHPEGLERDAAQAQPVALRTAVRTGASCGAISRPASRTSPSGTSGTSRILGRAHRARRLGAARLLHARAVRKNRRGDARIPTACSRTSTRRTGSCSASRCCSRWSTPGALAMTPTGSCSAATRTWEERRPFRTVLAEDPEVLATLSPDRLDECFELRRASLTPVARWTPWTSSTPRP